MPRNMAPEIMDDPANSEADFAAALADLSRMNRWSMAQRPLDAWLDRLVAERGLTRLSLLDVGAGGGDSLRGVAAWGARRGIPVELCGLDISPWAERYAVQAGTPARWITADLFDLPAEERFDAVICSLFAHHLDDALMLRFLRWLPQHARHGWLILDLHRHWLPWAVVWAATRLLRMHPMVSHDGPVSVNRAFTRADWQRLSSEAGVAADIRWTFPFRWAVSGAGSG
jgi:2-polyprenyl-3-methyl-5-hydroxy-6-metoxy-1,4-benzoquinol methylase